MEWTKQPDGNFPTGIYVFEVGWQWVWAVVGGGQILWGEPTVWYPKFHDVLEAADRFAEATKLPIQVATRDKRRTKPYRWENYEFQG